MNQTIRRCTFCVLAVLINPVLADDTTLETTLETTLDTIEEIVVTADFRITNLMDAAGSVSVVTDEAIRERGAQHVEEILSSAPNISWSAGASRSRFVQIRGIGDLEQYAEPKYYPSVGIMLDDLELGNAANAAMLFDVEQVEILRGPQGTRFGASAHAGLINIRSASPTEDFEGQLSAGVGNYDTRNLGLVLSGPLGDSLTARLAVQQRDSDGFTKNAHWSRDDLAGFDELTTRLKMIWQGHESSYEVGVFRFGSDNGYDAWTFDNSRTTQSDQPGADEQDLLALTAKGQWQLKDNVLQLIMSNTDSDLLYRYDVDWISADYCVTFTCSWGHDTAQEIFDRNRDQTTAEVRLLGGESLGVEDSRYVLGLYFNRTDERLTYGYPSVWYGDYLVESQYETDRVAAYGEYEYATGDLIVSVSARAERFEDDYRDSNGVSHDNSETLWNAEVSAEYALDDATLAYASLSLANKPGGVNVSASSQYAWMSPVFQGFMDSKLSFDDERLVSKEFGVKSSLFDGRTSLRLAAFHTDRQDAQLENWMWDDAAGLWIGYLDSTSDAVTYGLELEVNQYLTEKVSVFANLGLLRTEVDNIATFDLDVWDFVDKKNRDQSKSPEYQYAVGVRAMLSGRLTASLEVEGRDDSFFGYYHDGRLDSYRLVNASLRWRGESLAVNVWGRNLTDEDYATHGLYFGADPRDDFGFWSNQTYLQLGAPRTWGLELTWSLR